MDIVKQCQYIAIKAGCPSVMSYVKITYKPEGILIKTGIELPDYASVEDFPMRELRMKCRMNTGMFSLASVWTQTNSPSC